MTVTTPQNRFFISSLHSWGRKRLVFPVLIMAVSICLRLGLVLVNRQANDNHIEVINLILTSGSLPEMDDCWECFQPKLFHLVVSGIVRILTEPQPDTIILAGQWINFVAGILTLILVGFFIFELPTNNHTLKTLAFGLVALNPKLMGINSQATNDTLAILLSTASLFYTIRFFRQTKIFYFFLIILFTILSISAKTNCWVTAVAIPLAFFVRAWADRKQSRLWLPRGLIVLAAILLFSVLNPLNQYFSNIQKYGSPMVVPVSRFPIPHLFSKSVAANPGILSLSDGFFTFRYIDLLSKPVIIPGHDYSVDRTSLWTQLYGRAHSVHFDNWPSSWAANGSRYFNVSRAIYILALPPTLLLLIGFFVSFLSLIKKILKKNLGQMELVDYGLLPGVFIGYILFLTLYVMLYRDYTFMKVIFVYPAVISFPGFFISGVEYVRTVVSDLFSRFTAVFINWILLLFIFYVFDILTMIKLISSRIAI